VSLPRHVQSLSLGQFNGPVLRGKDNGSKRVSLGEIENDFESQKFRRMIYRNATQGNVEIQSLTGLQEGIRRYLIGHLLREGKNHQEIASTVGTSLRTVQRHSAVQSKT
jgi:uncharacterized protein YerC